MSQHLATETIKLYTNRKLNSSELLAADDHLAQCDLCLQKVSALKEFETSAGFDFLHSIADAGHLKYERLEQYADEKLDADERKAADAHLETCGDCRLNLDELFAAKKLIAADLPDEVTVRDRKSVFSNAGNDFFENYLRRFGFAAVAILIIVSGLFWLIKRNSQTEIAQNPPPSNVNSQTLPTVNSTSNVDQNTNSAVTENVNAKTNSNSEIPVQDDETEEFPAPYREEMRRIIAGNRLNFPAELDGLKNKSGMLMGGGKSETVPFALSSPIGKITSSNTPQFNWKPLEGAQSYNVNVYDENFNEIASSGQLTRTNWKPAKPLARNKTYIWQVTAFRNGEEIKSPIRPAPDARFKVLDAKKADELSRLSRQQKGEHLFLGILFARAGLLEEAESEFVKELAKKPNSKPARKFLQDVRARRK